MSARFEVVRTDAEQPWHVRYRAANGKVQFTSENYTRRHRAVWAIANLAHAFSPTGQVWINNTRQGSDWSSEVRYGSEGHSMYMTAHVLEIREVDERTGR